MESLSSTSVAWRITRRVLYGSEVTSRPSMRTSKRGMEESLEGTNSKLIIVGLLVARLC